MLLLTPPASLLATGPAELIAPWTAYDVGLFPNIGPRSIASGDLNGDGRADVVLGLDYFGGPGISVLLADGAGGFLPPSVQTTGINNNISSVALSDLDGDGDLDLFATEPGVFGTRGIVKVWRNLGGGTLSPPQTFDTELGPMDLVIADFDGDGFDDVVTVNGEGFGDDTISFLKHNGLTGQFAGFLPPVEFFAGDEGQEIEAADLDGDGDLDLVVGRDDFFSPSEGTAVLFNDGTGAFGPPTFYENVPSGNGASEAIAVVDIDLDGDADFIATDSSNGSPSFGLLGLRLNDGSGQFGEAIEMKLFRDTFTPASLDVADLNRDGYPDLVATTPSGRAKDGYNVILSDGQGGFMPVIFYEAAKQTFAAALVDNDVDGDLDVLTVANDSAVLAVHQNAGNGLFLVLPRYEIGSLSDGMDRADIDNDGDLDLVTSDTEIRILRNLGGGTFAPFETYDVTSGADQVKLRDLNNDGFSDLLWESNNFNSEIGIALNLGNGSFGAEVLLTLGTEFWDTIDAFDIDNDGFLDLVVTDAINNGGFRLGRNTGDGVTYQIAPFVTVSDSPSGLAAADVDNDGRLDLLTQLTGGVTTFLGNGDFTFDNGIETGAFGLEFVMADFDEDGNADIALRQGELTSATSWVATLPGFGDGDFGFPDEIPGVTGLESAFRISSDIDAADLTGDGRQDLILTSNAPNDIAIFPGTPLGDVEERPVRYGTGYSPSESVVGDFTGDGIDDVAAIISLPPSGIGEAVVVLPGLPVDRLTLDLNGACPGPVAATVTGAEPGETIVLARAAAPGTLSVTEGQDCAGTPLSLAAPVFLTASLTAELDGSATVELDLPASACSSALLQAVAVTSCRVSELVSP